MPLRSTELHRLCRDFQSSTIGGTTSQIRFPGEAGVPSCWTGGGGGFRRTFLRSMCFTDSDPRRRATISWKMTEEFSMISNSSLVRLRFPKPPLANTSLMRLDVRYVPYEPVRDIHTVDSMRLLLSNSHDRLEKSMSRNDKDLKKSLYRKARNTASNWYAEYCGCFVGGSRRNSGECRTSCHSTVHFTPSHR